jgi:REP-associated tyrosine transposase
MRCRLEDFEQGGCYHVYNHAVDGLELYREAEDYQYYLMKADKYLNKRDYEICCWCLMSNHFHFLVHQNSEKMVSTAFNSLNLSYVNHYNSKYKRKGKLYSDRLQHKKIEGGDYLLQLCLYIHLNPVKDGFVEKPEDWEYSDYKRWIDQEVRLRDKNFFLDNDQYRELVEVHRVKY